MARQTSVTPLLASSVDWATYLKSAAELTGHTPTRGLDASPIKFSNYASFLASLGELQSGKEQEPLDVIRSNDYLLEHLSFGFLIAGSMPLIFRILELTKLDVTTGKRKEKGRVAVVTGNLREWKNASITCLDQRLVTNYELRWTFNQCLNVLSQTGLRNVFDGYRRKGLDDGTFLLEFKG